jgi:hypothetical protein
MYETIGLYTTTPSLESHILWELWFALFQRKARLEVSGIRKGSESIIQSRVKMKLEQISPSDTLSPGYVCVVEFGTPRTRIIEKCKT